MKILCCSDSYPVVSTLHLNRSAKPPQAKQSTEKALLVFLAYSTVEFRKLLNVGWCLTFITSFYSFHAHPLRCVLRNFTQALRDKQLLQVLLIYVRNSLFRCIKWRLSIMLGGITNAWQMIQAQKFVFG